MKTKIAISLLFMFLSLFKTYSQNKIYLDENLKEIDSVIYKNKCENVVLKCLSYSTDSLEINKVLFKFKFGKLSNTELNQLKLLFTKRTNTQLDSSSTLIINYRDTIHNYFSSKRDYDNHVKNHKNAEHRKFNEEVHEKEKKVWETKHKKCIKAYSKHNTKVLYTYNFSYHKELTNTNYSNLNWLKDNGMFKNTFFPILYNYRYLVIKPDGNYFLIGGHFPEKNLKKLVKNSNWEKYISNWENSYLKYAKEGIFKNLNIYNHKNHCF